MNQRFEIEQEVLRSVAVIPIIVELRKGSRYSYELAESLRGVAAAQTINEGLHRLMAGGYVKCTVERIHGIRKKYELTERGGALARTKVEDLDVAK